MKMDIECHPSLAPAGEGFLLLEHERSSERPPLGQNLVILIPVGNLTRFPSMAWLMWAGNADKRGSKDRRETTGVWGLRASKTFANLCSLGINAY